MVKSNQIKSFQMNREVVLIKKRKNLGIIPNLVFFFFGWGLRVIYNSDIFEKLSPPWGFKIPKLKLGHFF